MWQELVRRLDYENRPERREDFQAVHVVPEGSSSVLDEMEARLVILGPEHPHDSRTTDNPAQEVASQILNQRGSSPRLYRNALTFLAPDKERQRYINLRTVNNMSRFIIDGDAVLVRPEAAKRQLEREEEEQEKPQVAPHPLDPIQPDGNGGYKGSEEKDSSPSDLPPAPPVKKLRRFHGSVSIDALRMIAEAGNIANEVVQYLTKLNGAQVDIILEISAKIPDGASEEVVRTVTENCRTLKFKPNQFYDE